MADVAEGLLEIHARGIVHRDVKPSNILWNRAEDEALLTDFGTAARLTDPTNIAGSLAYMAPEALDGLVVPALDVYSLSATLFHLVTGSPPFPSLALSDLKEQVHRGLPDADPRCVSLPKAFEQLIRDGLVHDFRIRPSLKEFANRLRANLNQLMADSLLLGRDPEIGSLLAEVGTLIGSDSAAISSSIPSKRSQPDLLLIVSRQIGPDRFDRIASTQPEGSPDGLARDMKRVPLPPEHIQLRTGDRVRIEVLSQRPGYLTVYNIGPTGNLNLLYPDRDALVTHRFEPIKPGQRIQIGDVELTPPTGRERLFAVLGATPLVIRDLASLGDQGGPSAAYRTTRDMKLLHNSIRRLEPEDCRVAVLEVRHHP
jgi:serine/threonine protein kinase